MIMNIINESPEKKSVFIFIHYYLQYNIKLDDHMTVSPADPASRLSLPRINNSMFDGIIILSTELSFYRRNYHFIDGIIILSTELSPVIISGILFIIS